MGLLAVPAGHAHGSGPSPEVDGAVRTNKTTTWNSYRVRSPSLGVSRPASGHESLELWWGEGQEKLLARRPTDLLAGVGGDGQSVGKESRHFVFLDQLHRYHRNDHLREREREREACFSQDLPPKNTGPGCSAPEQRVDTAGTQPRMHTLVKPCLCVVAEGI